jgi:hypothetical protein
MSSLRCLVDAPFQRSQHLADFKKSTKRQKLQLSKDQHHTIISTSSSVYSSTIPLKSWIEVIMGLKLFDLPTTWRNRGDHYATKSLERNFRSPLKNTGQYVWQCEYVGLMSQRQLSTVEFLQKEQWNNCRHAIKDN